MRLLLRSKFRFLIVLSFLEGFSVLTVELFGAKIVSTFFGSSLYVWTSVLGVALLGLATGYYLGGYFSERFKSNYTVYWVLGFAGLLVAWMPHFGLYLIHLNLEGNIHFITIFVLMIFMFPCLVLMGAGPPLIIYFINQKKDLSGRDAGSIYAISTLGGIVATFILGLYVLSEFGLKWPSFYIGLILTSTAILPLLLSKKKKVISLLCPFLLIAILNSNKLDKYNESYHLVHISEGVFGQIKVIDAPVETFLRGKHIGRTLLVNNISQSTAFRDNLDYDSWDWSYYFPTVASVFPKGSNALLMGLGGGTIVHQYNRLGFNLDVVEIDERIRETAINYFAVPKETKIVIDDARHYINVCRKTYDVITFDMFLNEMPPSQVLTLETFKKVKKMLKPGGLWVINYFGYTSGSKGKSARSILKTLKKAGFHIEIMVTPSESESDRNIVFLASHDKFDFSGVDYEEPNLPKIDDITEKFLDLEYIDLNDAEILRDEIPKFEHMYLEPSIEWRKSAIQYQIKPLINANLEFIK